MRRAWLVVLAACTGHHAAAPAKVPAAGITLALYDRPEAGGSSYGVVDDRRWIDVKGHELVLDHIDPGAALASLVIEPLGEGALAISHCERERIPTTSPPPAPAKPPPAPPRPAVVLRRYRKIVDVDSGQVPPVPPPPPPAPAAESFDTTVRCAVAGAPGRHLIRILYVSTKLLYHAQHELVVTTADRATVTSRFALATPSWQSHADVVLFDGVPGGEQPPRELAHGTVSLDGSIAVISSPPRELPARLRRVYDGAVATPDLPAADAAWYQESQHAVWVWLELPGLRLARGPVHVHVELPAEGVRDVDVTPAVPPDERADRPLRLPLWTDDALLGTRLRVADVGDAQLAERVLLSIANLGDSPREVWVEEHVRPARRRKLERAWPKKPMSSGEVVRSKLHVEPHAIERLGYTIEYDF